MATIRRLTAVAFLLALGLLAARWGEVAPDRSEATMGSGTMQFRVASGSSCMPMINPTKCSVPAGGQFQLAVAVTDFPGGGYTAVAVDIDWTGSGLVYKPTPSGSDEITWPDKQGIDYRIILSSTRVNNGDLSSGFGAIPSTFKGDVVRITMNCTPLASTNVINLLPFDAVANPLGAAIATASGTIPTQDSITINCVPNLDSDGDGCTDLRENGMNPMLGGQRNPLDFWDFFDTPDQNNVRDRAINTIGDILRVAQHFGSHDSGGSTPINRNTDPLSVPPPAPAYHPAFDRGVQTGANRWNAAPADGTVNAVSDLLNVASQYGHSCL